MKDTSLKVWRVMKDGGWVAAALSVLAVVVCAPFAWRFVRVWWMPAPSAFVATIDSKDRAAQYAGAFDGYVKQLDGRSLFYEPSAPGSEGTAVAETPPDEGDAAEPAATRYDGPTIAAMVLDTVWFSDGQRVKAGSKGSGDLEVVTTNAPWDAKVKWRGTEFTVPFFEHDKVIFKSPRAGNTSSATPATSIGDPSKNDTAEAQKPVDSHAVAADGTKPVTASENPVKPESKPESTTPTQPITEPAAPASGSSPAQAPPAPPSETPR